MPSNFEIAAIILLVVNIALTIWCLSKKNSEDYQQTAKSKQIADAAAAYKASYSKPSPAPPAKSFPKR